MMRTNAHNAAKLNGGNMTNYGTNNFTKIEAAEFIRKVLGTPTEKLTGSVYNQTYTMLLLTIPDEQTNNQHTSTDVYHIGDEVYYVTYFPDTDLPIIEKVKKNYV